MTPRSVKWNELSLPENVDGGSKILGKGFGRHMDIGRRRDRENGITFLLYSDGPRALCNGSQLIWMGCGKREEH